jgi:hypothetical protein
MALSFATAALAAACVEPLEAHELATAEQPIYYGTTTPSVVPLTAGEQMAIGFLADPWGNPFCSGTLIDRDVVVTAQHCTEGSSASSIRFGLGSPLQPRALLEVAQVVEHPTADAALLFLRDDAVSRVPEAQPLPFLRTALSASQMGTRVEAAGYGETHDGSAGRHFVSLVLARIDAEYYVVDGQGQRGICFGDSGGPLLVNVGGHVVVAGVESHGDASCVNVEYLTRLDRLVGWIDGANGGFVPGGGGDDGKPEPSRAPSGRPSGSPGEAPPGDDDTDFGGPYFGCSASGSPASSAWWMALPLAWVVARARRRHG